jgi:hypothetical protein
MWATCHIHIGATDSDVPAGQLTHHGVVRLTERITRSPDLLVAEILRLRGRPSSSSEHTGLGDVGATRRGLIDADTSLDCTSVASPPATISSVTDDHVPSPEWSNALALDFMHDSAFSGVLTKQCKVDI